MFSSTSPHDGLIHTSLSLQTLHLTAEYLDNVTFSPPCPSYEWVSSTVHVLCSDYRQVTAIGKPLEALAAWSYRVTLHYVTLC